jgi:hypothetical protein
VIYAADGNSITLFIWSYPVRCLFQDSSCSRNAVFGCTLLQHFLTCSNASWNMQIKWKYQNILRNKQIKLVQINSNTVVPLCFSAQSNLHNQITVMCLVIQCKNLALWSPYFLNKIRLLHTDFWSGITVQNFLPYIKAKWFKCIVKNILNSNLISNFATGHNWTFMNIEGTSGLFEASNLHKPNTLKMASQHIYIYLNVYNKFIILDQAMPYLFRLIRNKLYFFAIVQSFMLNSY